MAKEITKGFYYHYKHDPKGEWNNHLYEVMGIGHHTEVDGLDESAMVMYRPLYEAMVYKEGKHFDLRPFDMFIETVEKEGKLIPRFTLVTDQDLIERCKEIRRKMYD